MEAPSLVHVAPLRSEPTLGHIHFLNASVHNPELQCTQRTEIPSEYYCAVRPGVSAAAEEADELKNVNVQIVSAE